MTIRLDDELYELLRRAAFEHRMPMSRIVANALRAYLGGDNVA